MSLTQRERERKEDEKMVQGLKYLDYFFKSTTTRNCGVVATCYIKTAVLREAINYLKEGRKENDKIRLFYNFGMFIPIGSVIGEFTRIVVNNIGEESPAYIIETALNMRKWETPHYENYKKGSLIRRSMYAAGEGERK